MPGRLPAQAGLMVGLSMWYVYILKSSRKRWYYVGSTNRLLKRITEHNKGLVFSTRRFVPLYLVFSKEFDSEKEARMCEKRIKSKRIEKELIIRNIEN
ncbi:MAG: Excinuclease ABC subunit C [Parcubacteria group bacterium GW2011_GWA2_42_18]|nr:MAG: Excinuclease ABC subunit C [Parcubacteria group bacterium GW2011_GWA2_42_18]